MHYTTKCSCGIIISTCRCMVTNKVVSTVENGCYMCHDSLLQLKKLESYPAQYEIIHGNKSLILSQKDLEILEKRINRALHSDD